MIGSVLGTKRCNSMPPGHVVIHADRIEITESEAFTFSGHLPGQMAKKIHDKWMSCVIWPFFWPNGQIEHVSAKTCCFLAIYLAKRPDGVCDEALDHQDEEDHHQLPPPSSSPLPPPSQRQPQQRGVTEGNVSVDRKSVV